mmetsp:Transcript_91964/g.297518  ORF Transcript_91964/g.297518 Transcript_91964/m.297518 type:complete len:209 (-) Transcript_91964:550-1176(-)
MLVHADPVHRILHAIGEDHKIVPERQPGVAEEGPLALPPEIGEGPQHARRLHTVQAPEEAQLVRCAFVIQQGARRVIQAQAGVAHRAIHDAAQEGPVLASILRQMVSGEAGNLGCKLPHLPDPERVGLMRHGSLPVVAIQLSTTAEARLQPKRVALRRGAGADDDRRSGELSELRRPTTQSSVHLFDGALILLDGVGGQKNRAGHAAE